MGAPQTFKKNDPPAGNSKKTTRPAGNSSWKKKLKNSGKPGGWVARLYAQN